MKKIDIQPMRCHCFDCQIELKIDNKGTMKIEKKNTK